MLCCKQTNGNIFLNSRQGSPHEEIASSSQKLRIFIINKIVAHYLQSSMFSRKDQLIKKTGESGIGRYDYLRQLIHEFSTTTSYECKKQTLANLANFAYDPINYEFIKQLHLIDLFLGELSDNNEELIHFALSGLCNIACDPGSREYIISLNGVKLITSYLLHKNEEISLNALTTLYYLFESETAAVPQDLEQTVFQYEGHPNARMKNLGKVFLQTYFTKP